MIVMRQVKGISNSDSRKWIYLRNQHSTPSGTETVSYTSTVRVFEYDIEVKPQCRSVRNGEFANFGECIFRVTI